MIQDIEIQPRNTRFQRHVYYSAAEHKFYRGSLPSGYGNSDFGPDLRALMLSLKYCGNMSEPKIREFLANFDVQVSAGSVSNILTNTAAVFEQEYHDLLTAGLSSTPYQQTDDTSARVRGESWHTHILCNPFYTAYSTRASKDRCAASSSRTAPSCGKALQLRSHKRRIVQRLETVHQCTAVQLDDLGHSLAHHRTP